MRRRVHEACIDGAYERVVKYADLRLPVHFCLGLFEAATTEDLNDLIADLHHELQRREDARAS